MLDKAMKFARSLHKAMTDRYGSRAGANCNRKLKAILNGYFRM